VRSERTGDVRLVRVLGVDDLLAVRGTPDARISAIAAKQRGRVRRRQLLGAGITKAMIRTRLNSGYLTPVHNGVYVVGHTAPVPLGDETAALLAVGDDAALSHVTAGVLYEVLRVRDGTPIHVTSPHPRLQRKGIVVHRSRTLTPADVTVKDGLPITSVARTLLDIAEMLPVRETEWALDEALGRKLVTLREIRDLIARSGGRRGAGILKRLIEWRTSDGSSRTKWERIAAKAFTSAGLVPFEQNVWHLGYQHDFFWRGPGVTLEIDGFPWHSLKSRVERDLEKSAACKRAGLDPNRVTNTEVETNIVAVVALVATRLALRDPAHR
jgi:very-short-patch-repair endonuclease